MSYCVFIPGIQGSELYQGEDITRWPVIRRDAMKKLSLDKNDTPLNAGEMHTFLGFSVYNKIHNFLKNKFQNNFYHFAFDWRFELEQHFEDLYRQLEGQRDITIVAHSMGGLLTKLFVHYCDEKNKMLDINRIITLGTPWQGAPESLYWLKYGDTFPRWWIKKIPAIIGLNTADVMKDVCNTFPSVFQLLPHDNYIDNIEPILYDANENVLPNAYGVLLNQNQYKMYQAYSQPIQQILSSPWPGELEEKHVAIIGHQKTTFGGIISEQSTSSGVVNKKEIKWTSGDSTVPVSSGMPAFTCEKYFIKKGHLEMAQSQEVFKFINGILEENHRDCESISYFKQEPSFEFSGKNYKVACPVSVTLESEGKFLTGEVDHISSMEDAYKMTLDLEKTNIFRLEDSFFVFIDDDVNLDDLDENENSKTEEFNIEITAYDKGLATVEIDRYDRGEIVQSKLFEGLEISPETKAILTVPNEKEIKDTSLLKKSDGKKSEIKGFTLYKEQIKEIQNPKTDWYITNTPSGETDRFKVYNEIEIGIKISEVINVKPEEILEFRYMLNGDLYHTNENEFKIKAIEGLNKITVFTITKSGRVDKTPKTIQFEIGSVNVVTNREIILTDEQVEVVFNTKKNRRDEIFKKTFAKFAGEEEFEYASRIASPYNEKPVLVNFMTQDKFGNNGEPEEIILPNEEVRENLFKSHNQTVRDIMLELGLNTPYDWEIKVNGRTIKSLDGKITDKTRKVELSLEETKYIIVFKEDYELFWEKSLTEVITSDVKELVFSFVIKRSSSGHKVIVEDLNDIKIKVFSKENIELLIDMPIEFDDDKEVYTSKFNVSSIPLKVTKGLIKVYFKEKPMRELKFTFE